MVSKFELGRFFMTRGAADLVTEDPVFAMFCANGLKRHANGDWGKLNDADKQENELSLEKGFRLLSAYESPRLPKIWIITEADRSVTTTLFPEEY